MPLKGTMGIREAYVTYDSNSSEVLVIIHYPVDINYQITD